MKDLRHLEFRETQENLGNPAHGVRACARQPNPKSSLHPGAASRCGTAAALLKRGTHHRRSGVDLLLRGKSVCHIHNRDRACGKGTGGIQPLDPCLTPIRRGMDDVPPICASFQSFGKPKFRYRYTACFGQHLEAGFFEPCLLPPQASRRHCGKSISWVPALRCLIGGIGNPMNGGLTVSPLTLPISLSPLAHEM
jgi:hypothetical protein